MRRVLRPARRAAEWLLLGCGVLFLLEVVAITAFVARDLRRDAARPVLPAVPESDPNPAAPLPGAALPRGER